jgi:hypothetical protein
MPRGKKGGGQPFCDSLIVPESSVHHRASDFEYQMLAAGAQRICCRAFIRRCNSHCTMLSVTAVDGDGSRFVCRRWGLARHRLPLQPSTYP